MVDVLLENELIQLFIALGVGIGACYATLAGLKKEKEPDAVHLVLEKLQLIHEDIANIARSQDQVKAIDDRLVELVKSVAVMMNTEQLTFEKIDNIESIVELLEAIDKRR